MIDDDETNPFLVFSLQSQGVVVRYSRVLKTIHSSDTVSIDIERYTSHVHTQPRIYWQGRI